MKSAETSLQTRALSKNDWLIEERQGLTLIFSPLLNSVPFLVHAFTTRKTGQSPPPVDSFNLGRHLPSEDLRKDALHNRSRLCQVLGLNINRLVVPGQVHSSSIAWISEPESLSDFDAVATVTADTPVLLHYADCVPIILADTKLQAVCVIHAGWRGTAGGIASAGVKMLTQVIESKPSDMVAAVGPAIGSCCYPTGEDVVKQLTQTVLDFHGLIGSKNGKPHPDLQAFNALQLLEAGVKEVDVCSFCTSCRADLFYSHRRDKGQTGRQGAIAALKFPH